MSLSATAPEANPIGALLLDIWAIFVRFHAKRIFSYDIVLLLNRLEDRPWSVAKKPVEITELWLSQQLRPFGVRPRNLWIGGEQRKGYVRDEFMDLFARYVSKSEAEAFIVNLKPAEPPATPADAAVPEETPPPA